MAFDDLKLRTKVLIPLIAMAAIFGCLIGGAVMKLNDLTRRYGQITTNIDPAILRLNRALRITDELDRDVYAILVYDPSDPRAKPVAAHYASARAAAEKALDEAAQLNPAKAEQYADFKQKFDAIYEETKAPKAIGDAIPGLAAGSKLSPHDLDQMAVASRELEQLDVDIMAFTKAATSFNHATEAENDAAVAALKQQSAATIVTIMALGLVAVLGGLAVSAWIVGAKVARPLVRLGERMKSLAMGDLSVAIEGQSRADEVGAMAKAVQVFKDNALRAEQTEAEAQGLRDRSETERQAAERERAARAAELAKVVEALAGGLGALSDGVLTHRLNDAFAGEYETLRRDFNAALAKLEGAVGQVVGSAQAINSGAGQITQAADDMSRRTEQQAASLEETAAALDQITATVRKTAEGAQHARSVVAKAKDDAQASGEVVDGAVQAMGAIERSSNQISQIIGVIDEIAFQTNLLALNAGVEAARAGEAGRGFAVVAQEVRALAQRSADAAKQIKGLITASAKEVAGGVQLVGEAGGALRRIAEQVAEINAVVEEITHSTQEQATGLSQVNTAVNQMDQMTQQNAAMVEESTAASHSLATEARSLEGLSRGFTVGGAAARAVGPARRPANPVHATQSRAASFARSNLAVAPAAGAWEEF